MRTWSLSQGDPLSLLLAADARLVDTCYVDDQIWRLRLEGGEPPGVSLETTYGLRARDMRIFPGFRSEGQTITDPASFPGPVRIQKLYPNFMEFTFEPLQELEIMGEYWVPQSDLLAGRYSLHNRSTQELSMELLLFAILVPNENPQPMTERQLEGAHVLMGRTGDISPLLFMTGGATVAIAPYPALSRSFKLPRGGRSEVIFLHCGAADLESGSRQIRDFIIRDWDREIARIELVNEALVEVETGEPDWDIAFHLSQIRSLGSFLSGTEDLPHPSVVNRREPDHGHSERGDGQDYDANWSGQEIGIVYLTALQILPSAPELAKGLVRNYLATQRPTGVVDRRPGLGGQRTGTLCPPLITSLAWRIYQQTGSAGFLEEVCADLYNFVKVWSEVEHDRDEDGFPEWDNALQAGFESWPTFARWYPWAHGLDVNYAETPDLGAYLYRELQSLQSIALEIGAVDTLEGLGSWKRSLRDILTGAWRLESSLYHHLDRDLETPVAGERLGEGLGEFDLPVDREFDPPARILVRSLGTEGKGHPIKVFIHGRGRTNRDRIESFTHRKLQWFFDLGTYTTDKTYNFVEKVEVRRVDPEVRTEIWAADYTREDRACLMPLWAGFPEEEQAAALVDRALCDHDRFWRPFGIPSVSASDPVYSDEGVPQRDSMEVLFNLMLAEGLLRYGRRDKAKDLLDKMMESVISSLRRDQGFREHYSAEGGEGYGDLDHVGGVAPLSLFLDLLGLRLFSSQRIALSGENPFPWPIKIRWRGIEIRWEQGKAHVRFPNGVAIHVEGKEQKWVALAG